jgi:hypothetical protein
MTPFASRRALSLLAPCATTAIGSLPHTQLELALQATLQLDVPALPQLPAANPSELMIPAALEGLPGVACDDVGLCSIDTVGWEKGREALDRALDSMLNGKGTPGTFSFEPSPLSCRAWKPFVWEIASRRLPFAKVQLAGPATVRWVTRTLQGRPIADLSGLDHQIFRLLLAKAIAMVRALRAAGATPLLFLDEPGLYAFEPSSPRHAMVLQELRVMTMALQREGALVGIHCCSNTHWPSLLRLGLDILSLDMRLSLDALLEEPEALQQHLATGATLSLGMVPTDFASSYELSELIDAVEVGLRCAVGGGAAFSELCNRLLLTPACGLGMRSVGDAEEILIQLREAQRALRAAGNAEEGVGARG